MICPCLINLFVVIDLMLLKMPMMIQSDLSRCCGAKILPSRVNLLGDATFHMKLMDLTEAIIICEING